MWFSMYDVMMPASDLWRIESGSMIWAFLDGRSVAYELDVYEV